MPSDRGSDKVEAEVRQRIASMPAVESCSLAADTILGLTQAVVQRQNAIQPYQSDIPVTSERVSMTGTSCFDVVNYFIGAAVNKWTHPDRLQSITVGTVPMLEKKAGKHTFLTTEPCTFNGIALPKGALMTKADDDKWAMLRLTPFSFDDATDQMAFGSEMTKMLRIQGADVIKIGGTTIAALQPRKTYY